jgi:hypothetical protein
VPASTQIRAEAKWVMAPGFTARPDSIKIPVLVYWGQCSDGLPVADPVPAVEYSATQVILTVSGVRPLGTVHRCPSSKETLVEVPLTERLGNRSVVGGE